MVAELLPEAVSDAGMERKIRRRRQIIVRMFMVIVAP
jgi:hypothetical protein